MAGEISPEVAAKFLEVIGRSVAESTDEDVDRFVAIMAEKSQVERNRAATFSSATDIVQAAKNEMNECGCPYELPDSGNQLTDARQIKVLHRPDCPLRH